MRQSDQPQASEVASSNLLEGWGAIAEYLSALTRMTVTPAAALKWAARPTNPLPVKRFGDGRRPRVVAKQGALDRWCDARWHEPDQRRA